MSFDIFLEALAPLAFNGFNELDKYGEKEGYIIATLSMKNEAKILKEFLGQSYLSDPEYSVFQLNISNNKLEIVTHFTEKYNIYPITFQISENSIVINAISIFTLGNYLLNTDNRYIFLPVDYRCEIKNAGHRATVVIDKEIINNKIINNKIINNKIKNNKAKVYLLEPNGRPSYFNNIVGNIENKIESFFDKYFQQINEMFGTKYEYIKTNTWNPTNIVLNNTSNVKLSNGDCMTISMILCQIIKTLELNPTILYNEFKKLSDNESVAIIRSYSIGLIKHLRSVGKDTSILQVDAIYKMYLDMKDGLPNIKSLADFHRYLYEISKTIPDLYKDITSMYKVVLT